MRIGRRTGLMAAAMAVLADCGGSSAIAAPAPAPTFRLVFADEFNAGTLDRSKWNVEGPAFWVNNEVQAYVDSPETISFVTPAGADGGALVLKPVLRRGYLTPGGRKTDFVSGRINTARRLEVVDGRVEARIRLPDAVGAWPAFWMLGYGKWPNAGEIDIMEYIGDKAWTSSAIHGPGYSDETPLNQEHRFPAGPDATGWHVYGVERSPDAVIFFVDGREVYRVTRAMVEKHGPWRFDRKQYLILNVAIGGVYPRKKNGITSPLFGLPQSTVDLIARGEVDMAVDWVRVWTAE